MKTTSSEIDSIMSILKETESNLIEVLGRANGLSLKLFGTAARVNELIEERGSLVDRLLALRQYSHAILEEITRQADTVGVIS